MRDDEADSFWRSLTRAQVIALVRRAPKIAGPWIDAHDRSHRDVVSSPPGSLRLHAAYVVTGQVGWCAVGSSFGHLTRDEAKRSADAALVGSGWILVNE